MLTLFLMFGCATGDTGNDTTTTCDETNEACGPGTCGGEGGEMLPGADCLACHGGSGAGGEEDEEAPRFTAAGTAFADMDGTGPLSGATVRITDADGAVVTLTTNAAGNFYTSQSLAFPIDAEVEANGSTSTMGSSVDVGGCNSCHACAGEAGGKLTGP